MQEQVRKRPGPRKQYGDRENIHLMISKDDLNYIDSVAINRTAWISQAIQEKRQREEGAK